MRGWILVVGALALGALAGVGCAEGRTELMLASTTSTEDSGLFEELLPAFEAAHPEYEVHVTAVGTGQALGLGRRGDADVLLVHAPAAESAFVADGFGTIRCEVMYNDFVVVGPSVDPAGLAGLTDAVVALRRIAASRAPFISRGDDSGTHRKERALWGQAGLTPEGRWYKEVGQGMAEALRMASEARGYGLTDRATYLNQRDGLELEVLVEGDDRLFNQYGVIPVAGAAHPAAARAFAGWITGPEGQALIGGYGTPRFGRPLFVPNAGMCDPPDGEG
jgi:tungstate transport system substrate-binding protein